MTVLVLISVLGIVCGKPFTAYTRENLQNTVDSLHRAQYVSGVRARRRLGMLVVLSHWVTSGLCVTNSAYWYPGLRCFWRGSSEDDSAPNARRPGGNSALFGLRRVTPWFMQLSKTCKVSLWAALEFDVWF